MLCDETRAQSGGHSGFWFFRGGTVRAASRALRERKVIRQKSHGADAADHKIRSGARIIWPGDYFERELPAGRMLEEFAHGGW